MSKYKLVVFDLDGTLLNTAEGILAAVKFAINSAGRKIPEQQVLDSYIGPPIQQSFARTYHIEGEELDNMALLFRNRYKDVDLLKAVPYEGIYDLLQRLADEKLILTIATYKREDYAIKLIKHFGFDKYMAVSCGADFDGKLTKADIIRKTIAMAGITNSNEVVMIGDTVHDATGAAALGLDFIGVTYGFGFKTKTDVIGDNVAGVAQNAREIFDIIMEAHA